MTVGSIHPLAPHHLPGFLPGPDGSDWLFAAVVVFVIGLLLVIGNLYLKLHAIPERLAHSNNHMQAQAVTVLALLALFTHNNIFWVAALLVAVFKFPDFSTPLESIARSLQQLAGRDGGSGEAGTGLSAPPPAETAHAPAPAKTER